MERSRAGRIPLSRRFAVMLTVVLVGCGGGRPTPPCSGFGSGFDPTHPNCMVTPSPTCDEVIRHPWTIEGALTVAQGESRRLNFSPVSATNPVDACNGRIREVTWETDDATVIELQREAHPLSSRVWVTGRALGQATLTGRIRLLDGTDKMTLPAVVRVAPATGSPGSIRVAAGPIESLAPGTTCATTAACAHVPFELPVPGRVDVVVDWTSPLAMVGFSAYAGRCAYPRCVPPLFLSGAANVKPIRASSPRLGAGAYTLQIHNSGPGNETVLYEVWLTP